MTRYAKPETLDQALALLGEGRWRILAGATDFYPALGNRPLSEDVLDINGLAMLRGISDAGPHIVVGARTTWTDILQAQLPPAFAALQQAAREVGSVQIQNVGTVAGNLCNASPAADGVPPLLVLDAEVEIRSLAEKRIVPLGAFIIGNRRTTLGSNELVTAIRIPKASATGHSAFLKLGARRYLVISIAMVAAKVVLDTDERIEMAALAVGACSAVAQRLLSLERALAGQPLDAVQEIIGNAALAELSPIDDVRGSASYRRDAARELVLRAVLEAATKQKRKLAA